jgi:beta-lactamase superfamily II metal-dependent hydrolase
MTKLSTTKYNVRGQTKFAFVEFPSTMVYKESTKKGWSNHLLFGDYVKILDDEIVDGRVYARGRNTNGWIKASDLRKEKVLEVNFVDIGQGDGCHIVTPDDKHLVIDAGETDNMYRYLVWRFNLNRKTNPLNFPINFVISHSDQDHYLGFSHLFKEKKIRTDKVYHNGLVERPGTDNLGKVENGYITGLVNDTAEMKAIILNPNNWKGKSSTYCKTLSVSFSNNPALEYKALSLDDGYMDGYDPQNKVNGMEFSIRVLAPIREKVNGKDGLKTIKNLGKDKNGHSVVLKFTYGHARILLGGDVNEEFGKIIHDHYKKNNALDELVVDVAKACHHGSNHFDYSFIEDLNAAGTVISSGDDENYAHPRPDAIGAFGKCGYGKKPLVFSTELARSNKEMSRNAMVELSKLFGDLDSLKADRKKEQEPAGKEKLNKKIRDVENKINSYVTRYGMINLRTDGERMILAQKYERDSPHGKWDIHELEYSEASKRFELKEA